MLAFELLAHHVFVTRARSKSQTTARVESARGAAAAGYLVKRIVRSLQGRRGGHLLQAFIERPLHVLIFPLDNRLGAQLFESNFKYSPFRLSVNTRSPIWSFA